MGGLTERVFVGLLEYKSLELPISLLGSHYQNLLRSVIDMITYEDECVGCHTGMGCLGSACPYRNVKYLYCDKCGDDVEKLYKYDG